jgi:hypothetical protein
MGNPAGMKRKKKEKRRAKFEARVGGDLGPMAAYLPKEMRAEIRQQVAELEKAEKAAAKK